MTQIKATRKNGLTSVVVGTGFACSNHYGPKLDWLLAYGKARAYNRYTQLPWVPTFQSLPACVGFSTSGNGWSLHWGNGRVTTARQRRVY